MIETARTYLRPLERNDLPLKVRWLNDPVVRETLLFQFPVSLAQTEEWFERVLHDPTRQDFIVVVEAAIGKDVGLEAFENAEFSLPGVDFVYGFVLTPDGVRRQSPRIIGGPAVVADAYVAVSPPFGLPDQCLQ